MMEAMTQAIVGDDVLGDDPTVIELQNSLAQMLGKEAGLFVPSGTMSNAIAIKAQTRPGDERVNHRKSHIYVYEAGGYAVLAGCSISLVEGERGQMSSEDVQRGIRKVAGSDSHYPDCSLVCVENTANVGGGTIYKQEDLDAICEVAHSNDCRAHLDGARMFNAVVGGDSDPARMASNFDTISVCLSKGLGAPIGTVLVGDEKTIAESHRWRKMFGGGMRQSGILAAAGLYALENNVSRLREDHARARRLAEALDEIESFSIDLGAVQTNMVYVGCEEGGAVDLVKRLAEKGVDVLDQTESSVRVVVHLHITDEDIDRTIEAFEESQ